MSPVALGSGPLSPADLVAVARARAPVTVSEAARQRMRASRRRVEAHLASGRPVYGLTTGFGALADVRVDAADLEALQHNLVRSHAAGVGEPLPDEVVRAMMLLRANALSAGYSGVRPALVDQLVTFLNGGLHPAVPSRGSVGASGDLAQLAHIGLTLLGEGRLSVDGGPARPARAVFAEQGVAPLSLAAKEGLALINGTDGMLGVGVLAVEDARRLATLADVAAAMTVEAALGTDRPYAPELQRLRPHPGQAASAANLVRLLDGSQIVASHRDSAHIVQDPYSLRCTPQVHGAGRDTLAFCADVLGRELASVVDNPVILDDGRVESTGNFHGEPIGYALDFLAIALCGLVSIAERRTAFLLTAGERRGLSPFLARRPGLESGYMLAQYTQASLLNECKVLATPASADSIPTSGLQEDHNSMGWGAALKLRRVIGMVTSVLAIELLCAAAGLEHHDPLRPAPATDAVRHALREVVPPLDGDRAPSVDIAAVTALVTGGAVLAAAQAVTGPLR